MRLQTLREHGHGPRNLAWGVVTLVLALILIAVAHFLVGPRVLLSLAGCLLTFTALFVLARMHVFRQRNGGFLALGIVCLFGAAMPLIEQGYIALDAFVKSRPIAVVAPSASPASGGPVAPAVEPALLLTEAFALTPPDPKAGPRVKVTRDARVTIEGKTYSVKTGDLFAFASRNARDVTVAALDLLVVLPADSVEVLDEPGPAPVKNVAASEPAPRLAPNGEEIPMPNETPTEATARSQREVIRRYPALGVKGSLENQAFINLYKELRDNGGDDFFKNPEWPIELAELLAKRERWQRGAPPATVGPATIPEEEPEVPALR